MASGRAIACDAVSHGSEGANAPVAATIGAATDSPMMSRRRPRRSAIPPMTSASSTPQRTSASETPCERSVEPNSSAANAIVCVRSVLR